MAMTISGMVNSGFNYSTFFNNNNSVNQNATQKSIGNLWNAYASSQTNGSTTIAGLQEVRTNAAALVSSYDDAKTAFYDEFDANMNNLATSADAVRRFDFSSVTTEPPEPPASALSAAGKVIEQVTETAEKAEAAEAELQASTTSAADTKEPSAAARVIQQATETAEKAEAAAEAVQSQSTGAPQVVRSDFGVTIVDNPAQNTPVSNADGSVTIRNSDGSTVTSYGNGAITRTETYDAEGNKNITTAYSKIMQSALKTVQDFVDNYNGSLEFFQDNSAVSGRVGRMAEVFGDTTYRAESYQSIGINVAGDGSLSIDQEKLAHAIVDNPERVSNVLGDTGLADKADSHINVANSQRSQLFPSAQSMFGDELSTASFYTSSAYLKVNNFSNLGNLVNMMF